jgi:hypothetical protein
LNLGLAGCLIHVLSSQRREASVTQPLPPAQPVAVSPVPAPQPDDSKPFQWHQLLGSGDYRAFVKNLRAAGCPEPTIRAIVECDTDRVFAMKRKQLNLDGSGAGLWSQQAEAQTVAYLLGETVDSSVAASSAPRQDAAAPLRPLVFQEVDLNALGLNESQQQVVAQIRQDFIDNVGGTNQDPNDPAYLERWQKAQPESDQMIKAMLGTRVFEDYQLAGQEN